MSCCCCSNIGQHIVCAIVIRLMLYYLHLLSDIPIWMKNIYERKRSNSLYDDNMHSLNTFPTYCNRMNAFVMMIVTFCYLLSLFTIIMFVYVTLCCTTGYFFLFLFSFSLRSLWFFRTIFFFVRLHSSDQTMITTWNEDKHTKLHSYLSLVRLYCFLALCYLSPRVNRTECVCSA